MRRGCYVSRHAQRRINLRRSGVSNTFHWKALAAAAAAGPLSAELLPTRNLWHVAGSVRATSDGDCGTQISGQKLADTIVLDLPLA
jgi:hypothetical protein